MQERRQTMHRDHRIRKRCIGNPTLYSRFSCKFQSTPNVPTPNRLSLNPETYVHRHYIPPSSFLEEGGHRLHFGGVPCHQDCHRNGAPDVGKVIYLFPHEITRHRLRGNPFRRWRTSSCLRCAYDTTQTHRDFSLTRLHQ